MSQPRLVRNPHGMYEIRWSEQGRSRRRSTKTNDHATALRTLAQFCDTAATPTVQANPLVGDVLDAYLTEHVLPHTMDGARRGPSLHRWLTAHFGKCKARDVDAPLVTAYVRKRRSGRLGTQAAKDSTIRRELAHLQSAFRHAVRSKRMGETDVPHIPKPSVGAGKVSWLSETQVDALLTALEQDCRGVAMSRTYRFVVLALATGARRGAIEALTWDEVERDTGLVRYDLQVDTQTRKRRVPVPIADWLVPYLDRMAEEADGPWVLGHDGPIRAEWDWTMKRVAAITGDRVYLTLTRHALRHTCATLMLRAGATLWQVAGVLGDNPQTIAARYGHHRADHLKQATDMWRKVG